MDFMWANRFNLQPLVESISIWRYCLAYLAGPGTLDVMVCKNTYKCINAEMTSSQNDGPYYGHKVGPKDSTSQSKYMMVHIMDL